MISRFLQRNFWIAAASLAGLLTLLVLTAISLGGRVPALKPLGNPSAVTNDRPTLRQVEGWFQAASLTNLLAQTSGPGPFFTLHFQPPPPPTTRRVQLTYHGNITPSAGSRRAFVRVGTNSLVFVAGAHVVADHGILDIAQRTLILTNAAGQTNVLEFNIPKVLEVPIE
jgi:hypothetical protein